MWHMVTWFQVNRESFAEYISVVCVRAAAAASQVRGHCQRVWCGHGDCGC